jgi:hypothetical protein
MEHKVDEGEAHMWVHAPFFLSRYIITIFSLLLSADMRLYSSAFECSSKATGK